MTVKRAFLVIACLYLLSTIATVGGEPLDHCLLRVGWEDWKPYIYKVDGNFMGPEYR